MQLIKPSTTILVTGACGQIGSELVKSLRMRHGKNAVIATDTNPESSALLMEGHYNYLDVMDKGSLQRVIKQFDISIIYHLAEAPPADGEERPIQTWDVNINGLLNVLEAARLNQIKQVFWPSSAAVFGQASPKNNCRQDALPDPGTAFGISKCTGEYWCRYYHNRYGMDIRSLRYPGLISATGKRGGGASDYAMDIFYQACAKRNYTCFLNENTSLPMMYMPDAIRATQELMDAPLNNVCRVTAYNIAAMSFTPAELAREVQTYVPEFKIDYQPDDRQKIADSWPFLINDRQARQDWGWMPHYNMFMMAMDIFHDLQRKK